jgi:RimJ/RimL family protein N-acetyltransferase
MKLHFETERLLLRQFNRSDLETFLAYRNDPAVARYQSWEVPYPREKAIEFVQKMSIATPAQSSGLQLAVELKSTRAMIGDVAFFIQRDDDRQAMIGYSLARPFWRNGYATEAVSRLIAYLFDEMKLHRISAECDVENISSWRLLEKLGFRREAHLIENIYFKGAYGSEYHYAMLLREWKKQHSPRRSKPERA